VSTFRPSIGFVGASARSAAASAVRAGFQPLTADLFADADLQRFATTTRIAPYPDALVDWLRAVEPPAWIYTGALENHPELVDQMAWVAPLWGNSGDVLQRVRSPWALAAVLRDAGLLFPETRASSDGLPCDGTWLAKTYRGASGSGVRVLEQTGRQGDKETRREAPEMLEQGSPCLTVSLSPCLCFQRRIDGTPCAAVFVAMDGNAELLGVTRQLVGDERLGAHGFQYCGSIGPWRVSTAAIAAIQQIGSVLAKEFDLVGLFGVDFILNGDEVWTIEVNPRYTASVEIVERATGVHAIAAHAAACGGEFLDWRAGRSSAPTEGEDAPARGVALFHAKAILFAKRDVEISVEFGDMALAEALLTPWPTLADISPPGTLVEAGRPILTLFADGTSEADVETRLLARVCELERQIYAESA
jgi:predicted ATP-grasp superfamily ATP-dependent carboligase